MKKNLIILIVLAMLMFYFTGCELTEEDFTEASKSERSMFVKVEYGNYYEIVYHKTTKVMYAISRGASNQGTFTVLLNADGSPMLYESK